jgi:hypothetical protein
VNDNNFTNLLNDIDWHPDLLAKINAGYIVYRKICLTNSTVVHFLINNFINTTFPVEISSPGDSFIEGLPNLCEPGSVSSGYDGNSQTFSDLVNFLIANGTTPNASSSVRFYPDYSIPATIGRTFYDKAKSSRFSACFMCELYCFMTQPVYIYSYKR